MNKYHFNPFTDQEDEKLRFYVESCGDNCWAKVAALLGGRTPRECRERWAQHLSNYDETVPWSLQEDKLLLELHNQYGDNFRKMTHTISWRTMNELKIRYEFLSPKGLNAIQGKQKNKYSKKMGKTKDKEKEPEIKLDPLLQLPWGDGPPVEMKNTKTQNLGDLLWFCNDDNTSQNPIRS